MVKRFIQMEYKGLVEKIGVPGLHEAVVEALKPFLSFDVKILDCGAGTGAFALRLNDMGLNVEAVELVIDSFVPKNIVCYKVDLNSNFSDLIDKKYDIITAIEVIEHLENHRHFLRECYKLLNQNGKMLITTPNIESIPGRLKFLLKGNFRFFDTDLRFNDSTHITPVQSYMFKRAVLDAGFDIINHEVYPKTSYSNSKKIVSLFSKVISLFVSGIKYGDCRV